MQKKEKRRKLLKRFLKNERGLNNIIIPIIVILVGIIVILFLILWIFDLWDQVVARFQGYFGLNLVFNSVKIIESFTVILMW